MYFSLYKKNISFNYYLIVYYMDYSKVLVKYYPELVGVVDTHMKA